MKESGQFLIIDRESHEIKFWPFLDENQDNNQFTIQFKKFQEIDEVRARFSPAVGQNQIIFCVEGKFNDWVKNLMRLNNPTVVILYKLMVRYTSSITIILVQKLIRKIQFVSAKNQLITNSRNQQNSFNPRYANFEKPQNFHISCIEALDASKSRVQDYDLEVNEQPCINHLDSKHKYQLVTINRQKYISNSEMHCRPSFLNDTPYRNANYYQHQNKYMDQYDFKVKRNSNLQLCIALAVNKNSSLLCLRESFINSNPSTDHSLRNKERYKVCFFIGLYRRQNIKNRYTRLHEGYGNLAQFWLNEEIDQEFLFVKVRQGTIKQFEMKHGQLVRKIQFPSFIIVSMQIKSLEENKFAISIVKMDQQTMQPSKFNYPPIQRSFYVKKCTIVMLIISSLLYISDLISDFVIGISQIVSLQTSWYGVIRLLIILIPIILLSIEDYFRPRDRCKRILLNVLLIRPIYQNFKFKHNPNIKYNNESYIYEQADQRSQISVFEPLFESIPQIILGFALIDILSDQDHQFYRNLINLTISSFTVAFFANKLTHRIHQNKLFCFRLIKSINDFISIFSLSLQLGLTFRKNIFIGMASYSSIVLFSYIYYVIQDSIHKNQISRRLCLNIKLGLSGPFIQAFSYKGYTFKNQMRKEIIQTLLTIPGIAASFLLQFVDIHFNQTKGNYFELVLYISMGIFYFTRFFSSLLNGFFKRCTIHFHDHSNPFAEQEDQVDKDKLTISNTIETKIPNKFLNIVNQEDEGNDVIYYKNNLMI